MLNAGKTRKACIVIRGANKMPLPQGARGQGAGAPTCIVSPEDVLARSPASSGGMDPSQIHPGGHKGLSCPCGSSGAHSANWWRPPSACADAGSSLRLQLRYATGAGRSAALACSGWRTGMRPAAGRRAWPAAGGTGWPGPSAPASCQQGWLRPAQSCKGPLPCRSEPRRASGATSTCGRACNSEVQGMTGCRKDLSERRFLRDIA